MRNRTALHESSEELVHALEGDGTALVFSKVPGHFFPSHPLSTKTSDQFGVKFESTMKRPTASLPGEILRLIFVLGSHAFQVARYAGIRVSEQFEG